MSQPTTTRMPQSFLRLSLTAKLCVASTLLCVLCVALTSAVLGVRISHVATEQADRQASLAAREVAQTVAADIGRSFVAVKTFANTLQGMKASGHAPSREQIDAMARQVLELHPEFIGTYSIWEPNALDGRDADYVNKTPAYDATGRYIAYWNRGSGQIAVEALVDYEKAGANDWYDIPRKTLKDALMEPYMYAVAGKNVLMTTISAPVVVNGKFVGAAGSDMPLQDLVARIGQMQPIPESRAALVSNGGLYVAVQDTDKLGKKANDIPADALAQVAKGSPHRYEDEQGWIHLLQPVQVVDGVAPWSVRISYPVSVARAEAQELLWTALVSALVACSLAGFAMVVLVRHLMQPVRVLSETMSRLAGAEANLEVRLDEQGDDELAHIGRGFNQFIGKISGVFQQVRQNADAVASASGEIAHGNQDLSARTEHQASALQETAASMEQLNQTVGNNADNAQQAKELALRASEIARQGGDVMEQVVTTMRDIHDASRRISEIIGTIDGIAFQTNILALNAAVEAARAGEQGRGFAVVASEVRNLASRSAEAARAIKTLIQSSVERVEAGSSLVDQAGNTMSNVVQGIQRVTEIVSDISAASSEQAQGVHAVGEAIAQMDRSTQQNAALVEEMAAASTSLKSQANELMRAISIFEQRR